MNVLMVDDHVMFLQGMKNLLSVLVPELRVENSSDIAHAVQLVQLTDFELVLLDWHLNDCEGEESIRRLRDAGCMARIVVLSGETNGSLIRDSVDLGAVGFIPKSAQREVMMSAFNLIFAGGIYVPPEILARPPPRPAAPGGSPATAADLGLTERQMQVLALMMQGKTNKAICRVLDLAEPTVKNHVTAILKALNATNRTEAVIAAGALGLTPPEDVG